MKLLSPSSLLLLLVVVVQEPAALAGCTDPGEPSTCGEDTCLYQPSCVCCNVDDLVPDPDDCQQFYGCTATGLTPLPASCSGDLVFDPVNQVCVDPADYTCPICNGQVCVYDCATIVNGFISSHDDCNEYYECVNSVPTGPTHCPAGAPFFDGGLCQTEETQCCRCQPSCATGQGAVIDPLDCRKYWICTTPLYSGECDDGEFFDTVLEVCSPTAACVTACPNVVNTDGCIDPFTCPEDGKFAVCPNLCVNEYYNCDDATGEYGELKECFTNTVFHPDTYLCVNPDDCPYPEPESLRVIH